MSALIALHSFIQNIEEIESTSKISCDYKILKKSSQSRKMKGFAKKSPEIANQIEYLLTKSKSSNLGLLGMGVLTCLTHKEFDMNWVRRFLLLITIGMNQRNIENAVESMLKFMVDEWRYDNEEAIDSLFTMAYECGFLSAAVHEYLEFNY